LNFESKTYEAQLEDQRPRKSSRRSFRRRKKQTQQKARKAAKQKKLKIKLSLKQTPPNTLNASSPPNIIIFLLSTTQLTRV
jgi:hypothetical protein